MKLSINKLNPVWRFLRGIRDYAIVELSGLTVEELKKLEVPANLAELLMLIKNYLKQ